MAADEQTDTVPQLELKAAIGFAGKVGNGLMVHPDRQHLVYPLGCTIVIEEIAGSHQQKFLSGHTNDVTCIAISKSGRWIASGQVTYMGIVVWDISRKEPVCGSPAQVEKAGITMCIAYCKTYDDQFVTAGEMTLRVWNLDYDNRKLLPVNVEMGKIKRVIKCITVSADDSICYCGTTTGDILGVNLKNCVLQAIGPPKQLFTLGVTVIRLLQTGEILVGTGNGEVVVCANLEKHFRRIKGKSQTVDGAVSSVALRGQGHQFYVGDSKSHIYRFNYSEFKHELLNTSHYSSVGDVVFAHGTSELFATCSFQDIRVWHLPTTKELLRITIPNMTCNSIEFMKDGKSIISGWDDGKIRAFYPESGKEMYSINDAHLRGVTAVAVTSDCRKIISGGGEGQVRVWEINVGSTPKGWTFTTKLLGSMKEHKGSISCIRVRKNDEECVSASTDGTCIVWDLSICRMPLAPLMKFSCKFRPFATNGGAPQFVRNQVVFANTLFRCVVYHPEECQIVTSGTDRKLGYWETFDGALIRELEGSKSGSINGLDIDSDGRYLVTGGDDRLVKVWTYNEGEVTFVGLGHSGSINRIRICPSTENIVSVSSDGAVLVWKFPYPKELTVGNCNGSGDAP